MRILGDILKELRSEKKITLEELSNELNNIYDIKINKGMISKWEGNKSEPIFKFIKIFSDYYKVSVDYLLGLSEFRNIREEYDKKGIYLNKNVDIENIISISESTLLTDFDKLNTTGKQKVIDYTKDLSANDNYTKDIIEDKTENAKFPWATTIAAHSDGLTEDEKELMDKRILELFKDKV